MPYFSTSIIAGMSVKTDDAFGEVESLASVTFRWTGPVADIGRRIEPTAWILGNI
jgi:hypothetical protein